MSLCADTCCRYTAVAAFALSYASCVTFVSFVENIGDAARSSADLPCAQIAWRSPRRCGVQAVFKRKTGLAELPLGWSGVWSRACNIARTRTDTGQSNPVLVINFPAEVARSYLPETPRAG